MISVVLCTSKGYVSVEWALVGGHNKLAQGRAFLVKEKVVVSKPHLLFKTESPTQHQSESRLILGTTVNQELRSSQGR